MLSGGHVAKKTATAFLTGLTVQNIDLVDRGDGVFNIVERLNIDSNRISGQTAGRETSRDALRSDQSSSTGLDIRWKLACEHFQAIGRHL